MPISDIANNAMAADANLVPISASVVSMDAYLNLGSQYIYRGVALRDSGPVISGALTLSHRQGWFADIWLGRVDIAEYYGGTLERESLVDINAGYGAQLSPAWQWAFSRAWISGFDNTLPTSKNYQEWRANVFFRESVSMQLAYSEDYRQMGWSSWNVEIRGEQPLTAMVSGEWGLGHSHGSGFANSDYHYVWLGVRTYWQKTTWTLRWVDSGDDARYVLGDDRAGDRVEMELEWALSILR